MKVRSYSKGNRQKWILISSIMSRENLLLLDEPTIFFFQAEDGIRDATVTGVQTCALPILRGELTEGHARAVLAVPDDAERKRLAQRIVRGGLSVRAAERAAQNAGAKTKRRRATASVDPALASRVETAATRATGMGAKVANGELAEALERLAP